MSRAARPVYLQARRYVLRRPVWPCWPRGSDLLAQAEQGGLQIEHRAQCGIDGPGQVEAHIDVTLVLGRDHEGNAGAQIRPDAHLRVEGQAVLDQSHVGEQGQRELVDADRPVTHGKRQIRRYPELPLRAQVRQEIAEVVHGLSAVARQAVQPAQ